MCSLIRYDREFHSLVAGKRHQVVSLEKHSTEHSHLTVVEVHLDIGMSSAYCVAGTAGELTDCCGVV